MAIAQGKFREAVFHCLYALDHGSDHEEIVFMIMDHMLMSQKNAKLALIRALDMRESFAQVDAEIEKHAKDYALSRISSVEKNALRVAIYDMLFDEKVPKLVALSEGVRLCNIFGSPEGSKFVNGILHAIYQELKPEEALTH